MVEIKDGNSGNIAKVNDDNRLTTQGVVETEELDAIKEGAGYNINTGQIVITATTACLYIKNNEDKDMVVSAIVVGVGTPQGGNAVFSNAVEIFIVRNPTAGTMITSPTNVDMNQNRNYGISTALTADAYKGSTGETFTDGDDIILIDQNGAGRVFAPINMVLKKGNSIGIRIVPNIDATNVEVYVAAILYLHTTV